MKLRYLLLAAPVFIGYGSLACAARMDLGHEVPDHHWHSGHHEMHENYKWNQDDHKFDFSKHHWVSRNFENHGVHNWKQDGHAFDFKDHIQALVINNSKIHNVFLSICRNNQDDPNNGHGGYHGDNNPGVINDPSNSGSSSGGGVSANAVPVPAAAWLFGPTLLGLFGLKRKKA